MFVVSASVEAQNLPVDKSLVVEWLAHQAMPLRSVEPSDGGFEDLKPLKKTLKGVQIVGLGEATHGTREFFQFKHRLLEFLVKKMGFRVLAIELDFAASEKVNDYVMGKTPDDEKTLKGLNLKVWTTEEMRSLLKWMRAYNAKVPENKKVRFAGFDGQDRETGKDKLLAYIKRVAPERAPQTEEFFKNTTFPFRLDKAKWKELQDEYNDLYMFFELNGAELINKSTQAEYKEMREIAFALTQTGYLYDKEMDLNKSLALRDAYMANNLRRIVDREPAGTKFILWAHNGHLEKTNNKNFTRMGYHLGNYYGDKYYAFGFAFNQGGFLAVDQQEAKVGSYNRTAFNISTAPEGFIGWYLAQTKIKNFIVDFRAATKNGMVSEWLTQPHPMRSIGWIYGSQMGNGIIDQAVPKQFDGIVFIDTTTPAHLVQPAKSEPVKGGQ